MDVQAVEGKERELRERGAAWEPPSVSSMLRSLPLLADTPAQLFEEVLLQGHMVKYQKGAVIAHAGSSPSAPATEPFVGVILSGLAATTIEPYTSLVHGGSHSGSPEPQDVPTTAFLTRGSVFGVLGTLSGQAMPGRGAIIAHAETSATHVFQIPKKVFDRVRLLKLSCFPHPTAGQAVLRLWRSCVSPVRSFNVLCNTICLTSHKMLLERGGECCRPQHRPRVGMRDAESSALRSTVWLRFKSWSASRNSSLRQLVRGCGQWGIQLQVVCTPASPMSNK